MAIEVVTLMPTACKETLGGAVTDSIRVAEDDTGHDCSDGSVHTKYVRHSGVFVDAENNTREHLYIVENLPTGLLALKQRVERNHQEHLRERDSTHNSHYSTALTIEDCVNDAVRTFLYLTETCGIDPKRVVFVGESAGGGLPALAILRLKELHNQDTTATNASPSSSWDACKPGGALMCSPWVSLAPLGPISRRTPGKESPSWGFRSVTKDIIDANAITQVGKGVCSTLDTGDTSDPRASPLFADFTGVDVPLFVSLASNEWLRDDGIEFACKVRQHYSSSKKGNEKLCALEVHHGAFHAFQIWLFGLKHFAGKMVLDRGLQFLRRFDDKGVL
eukprot:g1564.t1